MDKVGGRWQATISPRALHPCWTAQEADVEWTKKRESRFTAVIKEECRGLVVLVCKVRDEPQPSEPVDDPSAPHVPLGSLSSSEKEASKQCRPQWAAAAAGGGGSGLHWTAPAEEAQAEHPRVCSDSSPAVADHWACEARLCAQFQVVQGSKAVPIALRGCKQASISTCNVSCSGAELVSLGAHLLTTPQQPQHWDSWEDGSCQGKHANSLVQLGRAKLTQCFFLTWNMSPR